MLGNTRTLGYTPSEETRKKLSEKSKGRIAWNKGKILLEEEIQLIKNGIAKNKKICEGCGFLFDTANYTRFHGDRCLIGSIKEYIPEIKKRFLKGQKLLKIAKDLNLHYRSIYKLKETKII